MTVAILSLPMLYTLDDVSELAKPDINPVAGFPPCNVATII